MAEWIPLREFAAAPRAGRVVALRDGGSVMHEAFRHRVREWRAAFEPARGDAFALYEEDVAEFAAILFGAWHAGKRVFLLGDVLPVTLDAVAPRVGGFVGAQVPVGRGPLRAGTADAAPLLQALDPDAVQVAVFTSGSTGAPEAIAKTLRQLQAEVEAQEAVFGELLGDATVLGTVSHQHIYGLLHRVLWPLAAGRAIASRNFFHEEIVAAAQASPSPVVLVSSPAHLKRLPENLDWSPLREKLRAVFSSGGALPREAAVAARDALGVAPTEIFGSSETGGIAWRRWDGDAPAWAALPGVRWRIDGETLEISSPHLPPDAGWWRSEDRAEGDGRGGFRLLGRADRIVKIEERRVSLDALERALAAHPGVREARVLALDGARSVLAAVVATTGEGGSRLQALGRRGFARQLDAHLADGFDAVARPRRWRFVDALPANAQGKTTQAALAALFRPVRPRPQWLKREADRAELEIELDPQLLVFDGHFPQAAILPGVAQTDWAIRFAREVFPILPDFLRMEALKFQQVARPGQRLRLYLEWNDARATLVFRYASEAGVHAGGRVVFAGGIPARGSADAGEGSA
ncbi:MAG: AMP-binding protein [Pseudoxanthomonas sp.]